MFTEPFQFFYKSIFDSFNGLTKPFYGFYSTYRPIILLPFNVWFFFATLPFRMFFYFYNSFMISENPSVQLKAKALELKESYSVEKKEKKSFKNKTVIPTIAVTGPTELRQRTVVPAEDRPFSWYSVSATSERSSARSVEPIQQESILDEFKSKLEEIKQKQEDLVPQLSEKERLEKAADEEKQRLEAQLNEITAKWADRESMFKQEKQLLESQLKELSSKFSNEQAAAEEKQRLEAQLKDLTSKFDDDEKALASFEQERTRFKQLIAVQQKKSFDFQQDIIGLKNQLRFEQESRLKAEQELDSLKKKSKAEKNNNKKKTKKAAPAVQSSSSTPSPSTTSTSSQTESVQQKATATVEHTETKPAWSVGHHEQDYTEMVAAAQREELEHKKFSDVVKESLQAEQQPEKTVDNQDEFTVIGGDLSSKHITLGAPSIMSTH